MASTRMGIPNTRYWPSAFLHRHRHGISWCSLRFIRNSLQYNNSSSQICYLTVDSPFKTRLPTSIAFFQPHKSYTLASLLIPSLAYLHIQHFDTTGTPALAESVQLPNLRTLGITPIEYKLVEMLEAPYLSRLELASPVKASACPNGWLDVRVSTRE